MRTTFNTVQNPETPYMPSQQSLDCPFRDGLLTASEVAHLLKVPISWVYDRTRRRGFDRMPHLKLGKFLRFSKQEVLDWLQKARRN
jgi:excisionase family DNA binding protein